MRVRDGITRRELMLASAGGLAIAAGAGRASAQAAKRIERLAPELDSIIATSEPIRELASGFGGDIGPAEGPVWWAEGHYLLFSDIQTSRRMKYTPAQGVTLFKDKTNEANGLTRDLQGRLIAAEHLTRRVTRTEPDGSITVVANSFQGKRLLRPNDVIVKSDGAIYFTDPGGPAAPEQWDVTVTGVYRVTPDLGSMSLLTEDLIAPNGLAFSPDESVLYINDSRRRHIRAFDLLPNGTLAKQTSRVFADLGGAEPGVPDGMKVDMSGNVYTGGAGGLYIMDSKGKKLGRIVHGAPATTNIAFGGDDWKTLYFTTRSTLNMVNVKIPGVPVPARKK
jgi:gluconolactonase